MELRIGFVDFLWSGSRELEFLTGTPLATFVVFLEGFAGVFTLTSNGEDQNLFVVRGVEKHYCRFQDGYPWNSRLSRIRRLTNHCTRCHFLLLLCHISITGVESLQQMLIWYIVYLFRFGIFFTHNS